MKKDNKQLQFCGYNIVQKMRLGKYNKSKKPQAFIANLYKLIQDESNSEYIKWREDEESFIIINIPKFSDHILPKYYKHSNYSSFVRQLNMYNFTKVRTEIEGEHVFRNEQFSRNSEENLKFIRRRQVTNYNNKNENSILAIAQAVNGQIFSSQNKNQNREQIQKSVEVMNVNYQKNKKSHIVQVAPPQKNHHSFESSFILQSFHFPELQKLKIDPMAQQFLYETEKVPSVLPLKPETKYFPLRSKVEELKSSQFQLQEVCVSLYKQNEHLTTQNKRLQQRLKNEFKKKQQILNQIIKYVINFLSEWNTNSSTDIDDQIEVGKEHVISDEESSSSQIIMESYDFLEKKRGYQNGMKDGRQQSQQKGLKFSKYAKNEKKILLTLLKEIQKSYNEKFFFTQGYSSSHHETKPPSDFSNYQSNQYSNTSPNNFMMSMLLKFIESNNLVEVIKRFSLLINLGRNKKSKNFTVVNCMKDLKQRFELKQLQKTESKRKKMMTDYENHHYLNESQGLEHLHAKEKFLENQKETIKEMEKELALITNPKTKFNKTIFSESENFDSSDHQNSFLTYLTQKFKEDKIYPDTKKYPKRNYPSQKENISKELF